LRQKVGEALYRAKINQCIEERGYNAIYAVRVDPSN
jgi:hypothetical protein